MSRVLVADDSFFMRKLIITYLTKYNYEIVGQAADGLEAIDLYRRLRPDILTLDVTMPGLNGIEALREIMRFDPAANVVMISAMGQELLVKEAIVLGAKYFLVKPFKENQLINTLQNIAKGR